MREVLLKQLRDEFQGDNYIFFVGLGFDPRCVSALKNFPLEKTLFVAGFSNIKWSNSNHENVKKFKKLTLNKGKIIGNNSSTAIEFADNLTPFVKDILKNPKISLIIDITTFSHELLAITLGILNNFSVLSKVTLLYVGASKYSYNTTEETAWLSRGVHEIRSILGFPGVMLPSRKLHLIVLAGFEVERAAELILRYEPNSISIGLGHRDQSIKKAHHKKNKLFFDRLNQFIKGEDSSNQEILHFEFSCVNPSITKNQLLDHIKINRLHEKNIIICPLNTKLSTVGAILSAIDQPYIQISYAEPEEYNTEGYAKAGSKISIFSLNQLGPIP